MSLKQIFKENIFFIVPFLILISGGAFFLSVYPMVEGHLIINSYHSTLFDWIFKYLTWFGDGIVFAIIIIVGLFMRFRISLYTAVVGVLTLFIISFISKELLFHDVPRPANVFGKLGIQLHYIEGVRMHMISSFPSGHATSSFAVYTLLALFMKNKGVKFFLFLLAAFSAYSRVYLSQHFVRDIESGAIIGFMISILVFYYFNKKTGDNERLDKSLLNYNK